MVVQAKIEEIRDFFPEVKEVKSLAGKIIDYSIPQGIILVNKTKKNGPVGKITSITLKQGDKTYCFA